MVQLQAARKELDAIRKPGDLMLIVLHQQIISPKFSITGIFLRCLDSAQVFQFAADVGAAAIVHGHKHMPYLARAKWGRAPLIISCGSTHHYPEGPFALEADLPSAYKVTSASGTID